ncbi:hypothetical protein [Microbacterium sp. PM5]|uniref:hypothetical protein n=1 Tax=Microbacterium sp. PM5 TaxID=2014534 RepID=UPI000DD1486A|nr:hypothetical protein [Microbacterium sp. PM5]AXA95469.1 hypothetical protein CEP17_03000 [Microbacterium sp. PM5]
MGYTLDDTGKPTLNDDATNPGPAGDFQAIVDYAQKIGGLLKLTAAERTSLAPGDVETGWLISETDTGRLYLVTDSAPQGVAVGSLPTAVGTSVAPTAGAGFTLGSNTLFKRAGFLLGAIDFSKSTGTLSHSDVLMTLPVGSRPEFECVVQATMGPSPSQIVPLSVTPAGVVSALVPPSGRTGGTVKFNMPIPM